MENLEKSQFKIVVEKLKEERILRLSWEGILQDKNPSEYLNPYLDSSLEFCIANSYKLRIDFHLLKYMNSSSIPPLIHLLRKLDEKNIHGELVYNGENKIQSASFRALQVIANKTTYAKIIGMTSNDNQER